LSQSKDELCRCLYPVGVEQSPVQAWKAAFLLVQDLKLGGTLQDLSFPLDPFLKAINKLRLPLFDGFALTAKSYADRFELPCGDSETMLEIPLESIQTPACLDTSKQRSLNPAVKSTAGSEHIGLVINDFGVSGAFVSVHPCLMYKNFLHLSAAYGTLFKSLTGCCLKLVVGQRHRLMRFDFEKVEAALSAQGRTPTMSEPDERKDVIVRETSVKLGYHCKGSAKSRAKRGNS
jgi:hypothetical protein